MIMPFINLNIKDISLQNYFKLIIIYFVLYYMKIIHKEILFYREKLIDL